MLRRNSHRKLNRPRQTGVVVMLLLLTLTVTANLSAATSETNKLPNSPREFYNDGTQKLKAGKLREAETSLQTAVASQDAKLQTAALYNLGHVRFKQGMQELTNTPAGNAVAAKSERAQQTGTNAIKAADEALAGDDLKAVVSAYQQGRGAQKELKGATEAVRRAMEAFRGVLLKWQRASGDFKSTAELNPTDKDAQQNAEIVDRNIAQLVDLMQMMMKNMGQMGKERSELRDKMGRLKKKMPPEMGDEMKGGEDDDDEEDDKGKPKEPKEGTKEGPSRDGKEQPQPLTPAEAERLLGMLRLDNNRKLPMGVSDTEAAKPKNRKGKDW